MGGALWGQVEVLGAHLCSAGIIQAAPQPEQVVYAEPHQICHQQDPRYAQLQNAHLVAGPREQETQPRRGRSRPPPTQSPPEQAQQPSTSGKMEAPHPASSSTSSALQSSLE